MPIEPGDPAPAFSLNDQHGRTHRLSGYAGRPVVLFFYPRDKTPVCTKEACAFQQRLADFARLGAAVLGISILDESSKARFAEKYGLTFPLLADTDHAVAEAYGAWRPRSMFGVSFMGVARMTYLIGPDGRVVRRWDTVKVGQHIEEILEALSA